MKPCAWCDEPHEGKGRCCCKAHDKAYVKNGRRSFANVHPEKTRICAREGCDNEYVVSVHNVSQKYCSTFCRQKAKRVRYAHTLVDRVCPTCGQTYQTTELELRNGHKPYCSDDCKPARRQRQCNQVVVVQCQRCGEAFSAGQRRTKYCEQCRPIIARELSRTLSASKKDLSPRKCMDCPNWFIPEYGNKRRNFCSDKCSRRHARRNTRHKNRGNIKQQIQRRKEREIKPNGSERVYRSKVFERDGWKCQLCGKSVDKRLRWPHPKSATIDHIIPLANGGQHVPVNCQLAHFICNAKRSNTGEAQLRMFA